MRYARHNQLAPGYRVWQHLPACACQLAQAPRLRMHMLLRPKVPHRRHLQVAPASTSSMWSKMWLPVPCGNVSSAMCPSLSTHSSARPVDILLKGAVTVSSRVGSALGVEGLPGGGLRSTKISFCSEMGWEGSWAENFNTNRCG